MEMPVHQQGALIQRLFTVATAVPRDFPVCLPAGELLTLLAALAATAPPIEKEPSDASAESKTRRANRDR